MTYRKIVLPPEQINLLRDLRKLEGGWLSVDSYLAFLEKYPQLLQVLKRNENVIIEQLGMTFKEFMQDLSTKKPDTNLNPNNTLDKPRLNWIKQQVNRLVRLRTVNGL